MTEEVISMAIRKLFSAKDLETRTAELDELLEGLNLKELPEYRDAVLALSRYSIVASQRFASEYRKRIA